jgi:hypothetical protein
MPYIVTFTKPVAGTDREQYINDCCIGGDVVLGQLLPALRVRYGASLDANQEDWGWYSCFEESGIKLAVDVHTHDADLGHFELHLTSRRPRPLLGSKVEDTAELDALRDLVVAQLGTWPVADMKVERVDKNYR